MDVREVRQNALQPVFQDNKKRVGEVCEKCRDEIDYSNVREEQK